jgi:hypothetical protein
MFISARRLIFMGYLLQRLLNYNGIAVHLVRRVNEELRARQ